MDINGMIRQWATIISHEDRMMGESQVVCESKTPSDEESIRTSIEKKVNEGEMVSPTEEFLENTYNILNKMFFDDKLPKPIIQDNDFPEKGTISIRTVSKRRSSFLGLTRARINNVNGTVQVVSVWLNSSKAISLHDWIGCVLHEMVHVYDYTNNPSHFLGFYRRMYDVHGPWFLDFGQRFESYGFQIQKYFTDEVGTNAEDENVKREMKRTVFIRFHGVKDPTSGSTPIAKINSKDVEKYKRIFISKRDRNAGNSMPMGKLTALEFLKSENPNIAQIKKLMMKNEYSGWSWYNETEDFDRRYGPFQTIETFELPKPSVSEDRDEMDYEDSHHIDDEYARKLYDNIKGVVGVEKTGDGEYVISVP